MSKFDDVLNSKPRATRFPREKVTAVLYAAAAPQTEDCTATGEATLIPACPERETLGNDMDDMLRRSDLEQARINDRNRQ